VQGDRRRGLVVEMVDDPGEVSHPITVGVVEVPWGDLVDDRGLPPRLLIAYGSARRLVGRHAGHAVKQGDQRPIPLTAVRVCKALLP
jgi:hypothetical protein